MPSLKGDPKCFDLTTPCPLCGHRIPPNEIMRLGQGTIQCSACQGSFDANQGKKPPSTS